MTGKPAEPSKEAVEALDCFVRAVCDAGWDGLARFLVHPSVKAVTLPVLSAALVAERERTLREAWERLLAEAREMHRVMELERSSHYGEAARIIRALSSHSDPTRQDMTPTWGPCPEPKP